jgi:hypothetical protein
MPKEPGGMNCRDYYYGVAALPLKTSSSKAYIDG